MLYLLGKRELDEVFHRDNDSLDKIASKASEIYKKRPGFFSKYRNVSEFAGELVAPFVYPAAGVILFAGSLLASAVALIGSVGLLLYSAADWASGNKESSNDVLKFSGKALAFVGIALATAAIAAVLTLLSVPHSLASIATRSVATVVGWTTGYTDGYIAPPENAQPAPSCC